METKKKIKYWLSIAHYDLISAKAMLESRRFLYVGFLCHQVVEKCLKAYFWQTQKKQPPYIHNLLILSEKSGFDKIASDKHFGLFNELMPLNIQARYPEDRQLMLKALNLKKSKEQYKTTREFYLWIKRLLK
jgi:HEPN domain-containing protein